MIRPLASALALIPIVVAAAAVPAHSRDVQHDIHDPDGPAVVSHDNRRLAGTLMNGVLTLELRAATGVLRPEGDAGRQLRVAAFGERSGPLSVPAPLIRVPQGTTLAINVLNDLEHPLVVHGLCDRSQPVCTPVEVPPGEERLVRFESGPAGTYHYWGATTGLPFTFRGGDDPQLSGAFIVDPPGADPNADRVLIITEWTSVTREQIAQIGTLDDPGAGFLKIRPDFLFLINGRAWPHTERLTYEVGERVRWRVLNLSTQIHPMHLHGFYFEVDALGDGFRDRPFAAGGKPSVVTQLLKPGGTMAMTWTPEREGNWLFHCHVMTHVSPVLYIDGTPKPAGAHDHHHAAAGMTGMVLGVTVVPAAHARAADADEGSPAARKIRLVMEAAGTTMGFRLAGKRGHEDDPVRVPGPLLVLRRGEPVEITLVNSLPEATAIHWHGMELDSYYDGVHGWGGTPLCSTPMIEPGGSFVVRFTPPRAGTFMYHTHLHDRRQLTSGLYGAMLVIEEGETFDEEADHVFVIGQDGVDVRAPIVVNRSREPQATWRAAARHRIRLINITPDEVVAVTLQSREGPVSWRPLTKDGAPVPESGSAPTAAQVVIGVGETYDFEYDTPPGRQTLWLEVRTPAGRWLSQGRVIVR